jgi:hypothetical protein
MKRFLSIPGLVALCSSLCMADGYFTETTPVVLTNISVLETNQTIVTDALNANGKIEAFLIGISNTVSTATNSVSVMIELNNGLNAWFVACSNSSITASKPIYPGVVRSAYGNGLVGTNAVVSIPVYASQIRVTAYNAGASTNTNVRVQAIVAQ